MDSDDKKISQLTQVTSLNDSDLFVVSIDVGTAPKTRVIKKSDWSKKRYFVPFGVYRHLSPLTTTSSDPYSFTVDRTLTLINWSQAVYVASLNDASNYWSIALKNPSFTTLNTLTTAAISANTFTLLSDSTFSAATIGTADILVYITCTKVGSPGDLYIYGPALEVEE